MHALLASSNSSCFLLFLSPLSTCCCCLSSRSLKRYLLLTRPPARPPARRTTCLSQKNRSNVHDLGNDETKGARSAKAQAVKEYQGLRGSTTGQLLFWHWASLPVGRLFYHCRLPTLYLCIWLLKWQSWSSGLDGSTPPCCCCFMIAGALHIAVVLLNAAAAIQNTTSWAPSS